MKQMILRRLMKPVILAAAAAWCLTSSAWAVEANLLSYSITRDEPGERSGVFVEAHYEFDFPQALLDALHRGIPLYFRYDFSISKKRWYWLDRPVAESTFSIRLSFNPLTRRYRVSYNGLSLNFDSLEQATPFIKNIRRWWVAPNNVVGDPTNYTAELTFGLDTSQLPKPMQVANTDDNDWTIQSRTENIDLDAKLGSY